MNYVSVQNLIAHLSNYLFVIVVELHYTVITSLSLSISFFLLRLRKKRNKKKGNAGLAYEFAQCCTYSLQVDELPSGTQVEWYHPEMKLGGHRIDDWYRCGMRRNAQQAFELYQCAANHGHAGAMTRLGHCLIYGVGTETDCHSYTRGKKLYNRAIECGNSYTRGKELYNRAIECGNDGEAMCEIAEIYRIGETLESYERAVELYRRAAEHGNGDACAILYTVYLHGRYGIKTDTKEALRWLEKGVERGSSLSYYKYGQAYRDGSMGAQDLLQANKWHHRAALNGLVKAMMYLAEGYRYGNKPDVGKDYGEAYRWYKRVLEYHDPLSPTREEVASCHFALSTMYEDGLYVTRNVEIAIEHCLQAGD